MRRLACVLCLGLLFLSGCAGARLHEMIDEDALWAQKPAAVPLMKIGRGTLNVVGSLFDIPATIERTADEGEGLGGVGYAATVGLGEGVCNGVVRLVAGVGEILSFPLFHKPDPLYDVPLGTSVFRCGAEEPDEVE